MVIDGWRVVVVVVVVRRMSTATGRRVVADAVTRLIVDVVASVASMMVTGPRRVVSRRVGVLSTGADVPPGAPANGSSANAPAANTSGSPGDGHRGLWRVGRNRVARWDGAGDRLNECPDRNAHRVACGEREPRNPKHERGGRVIGVTGFVGVQDWQRASGGIVEV